MDYFHDSRLKHQTNLTSSHYFPIKPESKIEYYSRFFFAHSFGGFFQAYSCITFRIQF